MSQQDSSPQTTPLPYGEEPNMRELAIQSIIEGLKAKFKRHKKRHLRPNDEYRELAMKQLTSSIANGLDDHLGTGVLPADVIAAKQAAAANTQQ